MTATVTGRQLAAAIGIGPRTKRFVLRDSDGIPYDGRRAHLVLAALARSDRTPDLSADVHTVAYALHKSLTTARMNPAIANRVCELTPYQLCALVARVVRDCPETTTGGICDTWLPRHQSELVT